jgi:glycosyltransferase involved in cell wall biosynthesis
MRVDHVSFSASGGAGRVARDIVTAQQGAGVDANFIHLLDFDLVREPLRSPSVSIAALIDKYILSNGSADTLTSLARGRVSNLKRLKIREDSIVNLHWTGGLVTSLDLKSLESAGRKMYWTMHDMRPLTGFCHHSHNCLGFTNGCGDCPQARAIFRPLVASNFKRESGLLPRQGSLEVIVPSEWMKRKVSQSPIFSAHQVSVIPNPLANAFLVGVSRQQSRSELGLSETSFVGITVAEQLESKAKKIQEGIDVFFGITSKLGIEASYVLVGNGGESFASRPGVLHLPTRSSEGVAQAISASDVLISMSLAESSGMTVLEAAALGVPSVARRIGGMEESIKNGITGFLCDTELDFESALIKLAQEPILGRQLGKQAQRDCLTRHSPSSVAANYIQAYERTGLVDNR